MLIKIILFFTINTFILAGVTTINKNSSVTLTGIEPITITASNYELDFGENQIEAGKNLKPDSPILLVVDGVYSKSISVKVSKEIILTSSLDTERKILFNSILTGNNIDATINGNDLIWDSGSQVLGTTSINLEFSGNILLTNLEEVGTYIGIARIEVKYN